MFGEVHPGFSCFFHGNAVHLFKVIKKMVGAARIELATPPELSGTSVAMIEKHYGHLVRDDAEDALATLVV